MTTRDELVALALTLDQHGATSVGATVRPELGARVERRATGAGPQTVAPSELPRLDFSEGSELEIRGVLGEGGMGIVELARQRSLSRDVAIKRLRSEMLDERSVRGLLAEASFTGYLEHPSIVPVHALGCNSDHGPLIVMKRVEGVTLAELLGEPEHPAWAEARDDRRGWLVRHLMEVTRAIEFAHSRGVLHRDIKPENVMVGGFGEVYLLDWGIAIRADEARTLPAGALAGTPSFMAPEMLTPELGAIGPRTDVYLLGATLHSILTGGEPRHDGDTLASVIVTAYESAPVEYGPDVPEELGAIANRATASAPEERFASALELREALEAWLAHRGSVELTEASVEQLERLRARLAAKTERGGEHALFYACRFGLEQALRAWPQNAAAARARAELLELMARFEIEQRNLGAARALLSELEAIPDDLRDAMARLDEELLREAEERRRFERAVHEHDPVVSARQRRLAFRILATMGVVAGSAITIGVELLGLSAPSPIVAALGAIPLIGITIGVLVVFRRVFLGTRHNRLIALTVIVGAVGVVLHRFVGVIRGDPTRDIVSGDAFVLALVCALAAVTLRRSLLAPTAFFLTAAAIGAYDSRFAFMTIGPAVILTVLVIAFGGDRGSEPLIGHVFGDDDKRE